MDRRLDAVGERGIDHFTGDRDGVDGVAAGARDLAIRDPDVARIFEMHEPASLRQLPPQAVEDETRERDVVGAVGRNQRGTLGEDELGRAAHADELGACIELEIADAVDAGRDGERCARGRGRIKRALERAALIVGAAAAADRIARRRDRAPKSATAGAAARRERRYSWPRRSEREK